MPARSPCWASACGPLRPACCPGLDSSRQHKPLYGGLRVANCSARSADEPVLGPAVRVDRLRDRAIPFDAKVGKLSGGQRTQVALVMALAKRPSLLLLDEPLSDLDPVARREVMGTLMVDLAERNVTVVLSSHSLADLTRACDWLVLGGRRPSCGWPTRSTRCWPGTSC